MSFLVLDYETRSEANLKDIGAFEYANHPTTEIICMAWKFAETKEGLRDAKTRFWSPFLPIEERYSLIPFMKKLSRSKISAHNAFFEQVITKFVLHNYAYVPNLPVERWHCTAAQARGVGLPGKLEMLGKVLNLKHQKDMAGHRVMLKWSKPRRASKNNSDKWCSDPEELERIIQYCIADVESETEVFLTLPELSTEEEKIWQMDQKINWRGFTVDRPLVTTVLDMIKEEEDILLKKSDELSCGLFRPTQRAKVLEWFQGENFPLPNLKADTIRDALEKPDVPDDCRTMLKVMQSVGKTSAKKYLAFEARSRVDGRIRDHLVYSGTTTRRWAGAGVQVQNLPARGAIKDFRIALEAIATWDLELVRILFGDPMAAFSGVIRNMIKASPGHELFCADYSAIELRVLFWVAGEMGPLQDLHNGQDLYKKLAAIIYRVKLEDVTPAQRDVGKRAILGSGYGMGWKKFILTCKQFANIEIEEEVAKTAINVYRETFELVPALWYNLERAAISAVRKPGAVYSVNKTKWYMSGNFLICELPSGGKLHHYKPQIKGRKTPWGEEKPNLHYWMVDPFTKKWTFDHTYGGALTENVCSSIARDFMATAMLKLEEKKYKVLFSVHDEVLAERKKGFGKFDEFKDIMTTLPAWGQDCFLKVEGWNDDRYRKG